MVLSQKNKKLILHVHFKLKNQSLQKKIVTRVTLNSQTNDFQ